MPKIKIRRVRESGKSRPGRGTDGEGPAKSHLTALLVEQYEDTKGAYDELDEGDQAKFAECMQCVDGMHDAFLSDGSMVSL